MRAAPVALALVALTLAGCPGGGPEVALKGHHYEVEIVSDPAGRERGLMFRDRMDAAHGMLIVFDDDAPRYFWMKNTRIPLDILYFDKDGRFVSGQFGVPPCGSGGNNCPTYPSTGAARYVLELNAGVGKALALAPGDPITLPAR
jgi:uncharacterized membrane protein (UPF0127 family)